MKKIGLILGAIVALVIICAAAAWWSSTPRAKLPWSARNVRVYSKSYGVQGWSYALRATLPERDFQKFVSRLDVRPLTTNYYPYIQWNSGGPTNWWNPSPSVETTYGRDNGMGLDILKYEDGEVWFKSTGS